MTTVLATLLSSADPLSMLPCVYTIPYILRNIPYHTSNTTLVSEMTTVLAPMLSSALCYDTIRYILGNIPYHTSNTTLLSVLAYHTMYSIHCIHYILRNTAYNTSNTNLISEMTLLLHHCNTQAPSSTCYQW